MDKFIFPILKIKEIKPLLHKDKNIFAHALKASTEGGKIFTLYENKGLDISNCIGQEMECLLEITRGRFEYRLPQKDKAVPNNIGVFKYEWIIRPFEFFPELIKIKESLQGLNPAEEDSNDALFKDTAVKFFKNWGTSGLNIGIYQAKPVFSSSDGFFLVNEHEFEEGIENLELNEEVKIRIDELFLRGIRPLKSSKDPKQKQPLAQPKPKVEPTPPIPKEEIPEKKKGRFDSLLDF